VHRPTYDDFNLHFLELFPLRVRLVQTSSSWNDSDHFYVHLNIFFCILLLLKLINVNDFNRLLNPNRHQNTAEKTFYGEVSADIASREHLQRAHTHTHTHTLRSPVAREPNGWRLLEKNSGFVFPGRSLRCSVWLMEPLVHETVQSYPPPPHVYMSGSLVEQTFVIIALRPHAVSIITHTIQYSHRAACVCVCVCPSLLEVQLLLYLWEAAFMNTRVVWRVGGGSQHLHMLRQRWWCHLNSETRFCFHGVIVTWYLNSEAARRLFLTRAANALHTHTSVNTSCSSGASCCSMEERWCEAASAPVLGFRREKSLNSPSVTHTHTHSGWRKGDHTALSSHISRRGAGEAPDVWSDCVIAAR